VLDDSSNYDNESEDEHRRAYCTSCYDNIHVLNFLRPLTLNVNGNLKKGEEREQESEDYENWRECPRCGSRYNMNKTEVKHEAEIEGFVDEDNYADSNRDSDHNNMQAAFRYRSSGNGKTRNRNRKKKGRLQRYAEELNKDKNEIKDTDVKQSLKKGDVLISYEEYQIE
jgi:hypothetical protein